MRRKRKKTKPTWKRKRSIRKNAEVEEDAEVRDQPKPVKETIGVRRPHCEGERRITETTDVKIKSKKKSRAQEERRESQHQEEEESRGPRHHHRQQGHQDPTRAGRSRLHLRRNHKRHVHEHVDARDFLVSSFPLRRAGVRGRSHESAAADNPSAHNTRGRTGTGTGKSSRYHRAAVVVQHVDEELFRNFWFLCFSFRPRRAAAKL
mmetsp:Transcript_27531/g.84440  ORF Transcript_27531/g.84440 Transcript_27531/m.84440 type:complete len:206 (-) Transcript_27531:143-760(-)